MTSGLVQARTYRGARAIVLLRVSTQEQEKNFGFPSQLEQIRKKLIDPLQLKVDPKHIIEDTYTGLEFVLRDALKLIEQLADEYGDPENPVLLLADCLDRIGRKGLERELYRAQLRKKGMRILTTDPAEHSDDDSLIGEMIRLLHGFKAEQELNDIRRRTMNGKRAKVAAEKDPTQRKLVGSGSRRYGYTWTYNAKHKRDGWKLNEEILLKHANGIEWTEVHVVRYVFELAYHGTPIRQIALRLNEIGIPSISGKKWQSSSIGAMLAFEGYATGYTCVFKKRTLERLPGKKRPRTEHRPAEEQVQVAIPTIIDLAVYQKVKEQRSKNKKNAPRRNKHPQETLLRVGIVRCAACEGGMSVAHRSGERRVYQCNNMSKIERCSQPTSIDAHPLDEEVWQYVVNVMRNPVQIDKELQEFVTNHDADKQRKKATKELAEIKKSIVTFRKQLADLMMKGKLDSQTEEFLTEQLQDLLAQEEAKKSEIHSEEKVQAQWNTLQQNVTSLYDYCQLTIEKIDDPKYEFSYEEKREALEKLGVAVHIYKKGNKHRVKKECRPPSIVSIAS